MKKIIDKDLTLYFNSNYPKTYSKQSNKKYTVYLGIGGNIGDMKKTFNLLLLSMNSNSNLTMIKTSAILKNPPFGFLQQDFFYNAVIKIQTNLSAYELLRLCWHYENRFKRLRSFKDAPRTLDIDIIMIKSKNKNIKIKSKILNVPHIHYKNRQSVTIPLKQLNSV